MLTRQAEISHRHRSMEQATFTITQLSLGQPLQWEPKQGTAAHDRLIDAFIPGKASIQQKRAFIAVDFFDTVAASSLPAPFIRTYHVSVPVLVTSPASAVSLTSSWSSVPSLVSSAQRPSKRTRDDASPVSAPKRLPGFSIMTKDGVDITDNQSRGPKSKEQREHAAKMRRLGACPSCKRSKQKCEPSHHRPSCSSTTPMTTVSTKMTTPKSRASISPQSSFETTFSADDVLQVAHAGKRFSPEQPAPAELSPSDFDVADAAAAGRTSYEFGDWALPTEDWFLQPALGQDFDLYPPTNDFRHDFDLYPLTDFSHDFDALLKAEMPAQPMTSPSLSDGQYLGNSQHSWQGLQAEMQPPVMYASELNGPMIAFQGFNSGILANENTHAAESPSSLPASHRIVIRSNPDASSHHSSGTGSSSSPDGVESFTASNGTGFSNTSNIISDFGDLGDMGHHPGSVISQFSDSSDTAGSAIEANNCSRMQHRFITVDRRHRKDEQGGMASWDPLITPRCNELEGTSASCVVGEAQTSPSSQSLSAPRSRHRQAHRRSSTAVLAKRRPCLISVIKEQLYVTTKAMCDLCSPRDTAGDSQLQVIAGQLRLQTIAGQPRSQDIGQPRQQGLEGQSRPQGIRQPLQQDTISHCRRPHNELHLQSTGLDGISKNDSNMTSHNPAGVLGPNVSSITSTAAFVATTLLASAASSWLNSFAVVIVALLAMASGPFAGELMALIIPNVMAVAMMVMVIESMCDSFNTYSQESNIGGICCDACSKERKICGDGYLPESKSSISKRGGRLHSKANKMVLGGDILARFSSLKLC